MPDRYDEQFTIQVTTRMLQFIDLIAARHKISRAEVVRQAIREHLDTQEDVITSRSRLGRTVMKRLETMHRDLLGQLIHLSKLLLAAIIILLTEQGHDTAEMTRRILKLAKQPVMDQLVRGKS